MLFLYTHTSHNQEISLFSLNLIINTINHCANNLSGITNLVSALTVTLVLVINIIHTIRGHGFVGKFCSQIGRTENLFGLDLVRLLGRSFELEGLRSRRAVDVDWGCCSKSEHCCA
jgi:hypothetical protein